MHPGDKGKLLTTIVKYHMGNKSIIEVSTSMVSRASSSCRSTAVLPLSPISGHNPHHCGMLTANGKFIMFEGWQGIFNTT
jgi:hypothetical protein